MVELFITTMKDNKGENTISESDLDEWFEEDNIMISSSTNTDGRNENDSLADKYTKTQLRIVRTNLDYSIDYLKESIGDKIDLTPQYQRRSRWDINKRSLLIESLLLNIPIPSIFLFERDYGMYEVVDGRQRLETLKDFFDNIFPLKDLQYWKELNGKRFKELPQIIQRGLLRRTISATVLLAETTKADESDIDVRMLLFNRLNTGGIQLNPQELRNALYGGDFNNMLINISRSNLFTTVWKIPSKSDEEEINPPKVLINNALYKSMADCELVLRFFAIRETILDDLKGSLRSLLDKTMIRHRSDNREQIKINKDLYEKSLNRLYEIFDKKPFVLPNLNKPSRALYDALMVAYSIIDERNIDSYANIKSKLQTSLNTSEMYDILLGKGNSIEAIKARVNEAKRILMN